MGFTVRVVEESGAILDEVVMDRNFNPVLKGVDRKRFPTTSHRRAWSVWGHHRLQGRKC